MIDTGKDRNPPSTPYPFFDPDQPDNMQYVFPSVQLLGNTRLQFSPMFETDDEAARSLTLGSLQGSSAAVLVVQSGVTVRILGQGADRASVVNVMANRVVTDDQEKVSVIYDRHEWHVTFASMDSAYESRLDSRSTLLTGPLLSTRVDIEVNAGGSLHVPATMLVAGGQTMKVEGTLVGLRRLIIDESGTVELHPTGNTVYDENDNVASGSYNVDSITVLRGGKLHFYGGMNITCGSFHVNTPVASATTSYVYFHDVVQVNVGIFYLGAKGKLIGNGYGYVRQEGPGASLRTDRWE